MSDIDMLYVAGENNKIKALLAQIRNYYSATPGWELFEADVDKLIGRQKPHDSIESPANRDKAEKVILEGDGYDDKGDIDYDTAYCPVCNYRYEVGYDTQDNYCRNCGQKLDWSDIKDVE